MAAFRAVGNQLFLALPWSSLVFLALLLYWPLTVSPYYLRNTQPPHKPQNSSTYLTTRDSWGGWGGGALALASSLTASRGLAAAATAHGRRAPPHRPRWRLTRVRADRPHGSLIGLIIV